LALEQGQVGSEFDLLLQEQQEKDRDEVIPDAYAKLVKKNLDEFEIDLQEIPQDQWKFAINPVGFACMKCHLWIAPHTRPPHIHKRKPTDEENKKRLRLKHQNSTGKDPVHRARHLFGRGF
jgi:hypothetical protein